MKQCRLWLREAREEDCILIWQWSNDPDVRVASFSSGEILWEEHVEWFRQKMEDPHHIFLVAIDERNIPIGQARFGIEGIEATLSVSVAPEHRRKGYGRDLVDLSCRHLFRTTDIQVVHAYVKPGNLTSAQFFKNAGFLELRPTSIRGQMALHFERRATTL